MVRGTAHFSFIDFTWVAHNAQDISHTIYFDHSIGPGRLSQAARVVDHRLCKFIEQCFVDNARTLPQMPKAFFKVHLGKNTT
jgi:hypothetical protein